MVQSKRLFDFGVASAGLVVLAPLWVVIAIAIKAESRGPIFFRGARVGRDGKLFMIYKFRTMVADASARGTRITTRDDPRVTRVGKFLRRAKLDELPQLLNVWRGEMSLVGPRPEDPRYVALYSLPQRAVLRVTPGITGAASVVFRNEQELLAGSDWEQVYIHRIMPRKLELELAYLQRRNFWTDLFLLGQTLWLVLAPHRANESTQEIY